MQITSIDQYCPGRDPFRPIRTYNFERKNIFKMNAI